MKEPDRLSVHARQWYLTSSSCREAPARRLVLRALERDYDDCGALAKMRRVVVRKR